MTKPVLLLDCDGVLCDFLTPWLRLLGHPDAKPTTYDLSCLSADEDDIYASMRAAQGGAEWLDSFPGALSTVEKLRGRYEVYCVTALKTEARQRWLFGEMFFEESRIILTSEKHMVRGDIFVDDDPRQVHAWQERNPCGRGIIMDASYNREGWESLDRIKSLEELL